MSNGAQFRQQLIIAKWTELVEGALASAGSKYLRQLVWAEGAVSASLWLQNYLTMRLGVRRQGIQYAAHQDALHRLRRAALILQRNAQQPDRDPFQKGEGERRC